MFIVNQKRSMSINADYIDRIVTAMPRKNEKDNRPIVIALIGGQEEEIGRYRTMADCKTVISYLSFALNSGAALIEAPAEDAVEKLHQKIVSSVFKPNTNREANKK